MSRPILLDTCALIWMANDETLAPSAEDELQAMVPIEGGVAVSPISAWEIGQLVSRGRLRLPTPPALWFQDVIDGGVALAALPPEVLVASSFLPGEPLRDPADKIIAATARAYGYRIMTRDRLILDFAAEGHALAISC